MKAYRSAKYLVWIRKQACMCCGRRAGNAHHEPLGENMVGGKPPDTHAVPMCTECHERRHRLGADWFEKNWDVRMIIIRLLTRYLQTEKLTKNQ